MQCGQSIDGMVLSLCYVYPEMGMDDLKLGLPKIGKGVHFLQSRSHVPFPRNGFYDLDRDIERYNTNMNYYTEAMEGAGNKPVKTSLQGAQSFSSLANVRRIANERQNAEPEEYVKAIRLYENSIRLSGDHSAIKMVEILGKDSERLAICSTDDNETKLVPEPIRLTVAEAFAGLALAATHQGQWNRAVGYSVAALSKHPAALPFVNCSRIMAVMMNDPSTLLGITDAAILPFYLRTKNDRLYETELSIWSPEVRKEFGDTPQRLVDTTKYMCERFEGRFCVVRTPLEDLSQMKVEKFCSACTRGVQKSKCCARCRKVCYCSRECQKMDWPIHRLRCVSPKSP